MQLALTLGDADVTLLAAARGVPPEDARAMIRRARRIGRRRSESAEGVDA
jgi:hypothetical protein